MPKYTAVGIEPVHYPGGVICPGESAEMTEDDAARALAAGSIIETPKGTKPAANGES